jgi:hypothetical protein
MFDTCPQALEDAREYVQTIRVLKRLIQSEDILFFRRFSNNESTHPMRFFYEWLKNDLENHCHFTLLRYIYKQFSHIHLFPTEKKRRICTILHVFRNETPPREIMNASVFHVKIPNSFLQMDILMSSQIRVTSNALFIVHSRTTALLYRPFRISTVEILPEVRPPPTILSKNSSYFATGELCCICMETPICCETICGHFFCSCVLQHFKIRNECPVCRSDVSCLFFSPSQQLKTK